MYPIKWWPHVLARIPGKIWGFLQNLYWAIAFRYFLPTVWVQPNMRSGLIRYIELTRELLKLKESDPRAEEIRDEMDPLWLEFTADERAILDSGKVPFPTVPDAIRALPARGGTIMCGPGTQLLIEPIVFPDKAIRLIGGQFSAMGSTMLEMTSGGPFHVIGCMFMAETKGPRDWSPRGEIPEGPPPSMINIHVDPEP